MALGSQALRADAAGKPPALTCENATADLRDREVDDRQLAHVWSRCVRDAMHGQRTRDGRADPVDAEALPVRRGLEHERVAQAGLGADDQLGEQALDRLAAELLGNLPIHLRTRRHLVLAGVHQHSSSSVRYNDMYLIQEHVSEW